MPIKKILVTLDGSKNSFRGLDEAITLARHCHATVTGLYVIPLTQPVVSQQISLIEKNHLKYAARFMEKAKKRSAQYGIIFYDKIVYGNEEKQIIAFSTKNNFDLIVMGSRGMGTTKEFFLGSTSNYVVHKSQIPTLIVK